MSFCLYDSRGYIGDLATNAGMDALTTYINDKGGPKLQSLAEDGSVRISKGLADELENIPDSLDPDVQSTLDILKEYAVKCEDIIIITDGIFEEEVEKGGEGSGNYGHEGRPGEVGGSEPGGSSGGGEEVTAGRARVVEKLTSACAGDTILEGRMRVFAEEFDIEEHYLSNLKTITQEGDAFGKPSGDGFILKFGGGKTVAYHNAETQTIHIRERSMKMPSGKKIRFFPDAIFAHELGHNFVRGKEDRKQWNDIADKIANRVVGEIASNRGIGGRFSGDELLANAFGSKIGKTEMFRAEYSKIKGVWTREAEKLGIDVKYRDLDNLMKK